MLEVDVLPAKAVEEVQELLGNDTKLATSRSGRLDQILRLLMRGRFVQVGDDARRVRSGIVGGRRASERSSSLRREEKLGPNWTRGRAKSLTRTR
jgi:hypothetical protein